MKRGGALGIGLAFLAVVSLVRARDCAPPLLRNAFAAQTSHLPAVASLQVHCEPKSFLQSPYHLDSGAPSRERRRDWGRARPMMDDAMVEVTLVVPFPLAAAEQFVILSGLFQSPACSIYSTCFEDAKAFGNSVVQLADPMNGGYCTGEASALCLHRRL